jgi:hypothetical protein
LIKRSASRTWEELKDLVEDRLPAAYAEIPVISQATYDACQACSEARLKAAEAAAA